jgi:hypothetical protein
MIERAIGVIAALAMTFGLLILLIPAVGILFGLLKVCGDRCVVKIPHNFS